jgi:hypothetical protein
MEENQPPIVPLQNVRTTSAAPVSFDLMASDPEGSSLTFVIVRPPFHGQLTGTLPHLVYQAEAGYDGPDSFIYQVCDEAKICIDQKYVINDVGYYEYTFLPKTVVLGPSMQSRAPYRILVVNGQQSEPFYYGLFESFEGPGSYSPDSGVFTAPDEILQPTDTLYRSFDVIRGIEAVARFQLLPFSSIPFTDDFNGALKENWGEIGFNNPTDTVTTPGWLLLDVPPQPDFSFPLLSTTEIVRPVQGDYSSETRIRVDANAVSPDTSSGLSLSSGWDRYARFGLNSYNTLSLDIFDSGFKKTLSKTPEEKLDLTQGVYLKMSRKKGLIVGYYSLDDVNWKEALSYVFLPSRNQDSLSEVTGIYGLNAENDPSLSFKPNFDFFSLQPIEPFPNVSASTFEATPPSELFRGQQVMIPLTLHESEEVLAGSLTFNVLNSDAPTVVLQGIVSYDTKSEYNLFRWTAATGATFAFRENSPNNLPDFRIYLNVPSTPIGKTGAFPVTLEVQGELVTSSGVKSVASTLKIADLKNRLFGDANGDGKITVQDALLALKASIGLIHLSPQQLYYLDIEPYPAPTVSPLQLPASERGDGKMTLSDVTTILRAAVGFPIG